MSSPTSRSYGFFTLSLLTLFSVSLAASDEKDGKKFVPPELQVSDPEIRQLVESTQQQSGCGSLERSISVLRKAQELSTSRKLISDRALIEDALGGLFFANGKLDDARQMFLKGLEDATSSSNLAVQADVLVALAVFEQVKEKPGAGIDLLQRALKKARRSKSLFLQSRVLGELGRAQISFGQQQEARSSLEEALRIDEVNRYDWLAGHRLYLAWLLAVEPNENLNEALDMARSARSLAIRQENYLVFVQASTSLAQGLIRIGEADHAVALLERTRDGATETETSVWRKPDDYQCALKLPVLRLMLLEGLALGYQAAKRPDSAVKTWLEVYQLADAQGTTLLVAESSHALGDHFFAARDNVQAAKYYSIASAQWAALGNDTRLAAALIGVATSSFNAGENAEAIRRLGELVAVVERQGNLILQLSAELELGKAFYRDKKYDIAVPHLVKAEELAGSLTGKQELDKKSLLSLYTLLGNCYESLHRPLDELLALENALVIAAEINDPILPTLYAAVQQGIQALLSTTSPEKLVSSGDVFDGFVLSELRYNFEYTKAIVVGHDKTWLNENNADLSRIITLPEQIAWQPDGPERLQTHLGRAGTVGSASKGPTLLALARRYAVKGDRPELAEKFARAAFANYSGSGKTALLSIYAQCYLATALSRLGRDKEAKKEVASCTSLSRQLADQQLLVVASATAAFVYSVAHDNGQAKEAISYLLTKNPDDPNLCEQLADAYGQLKNYDQQLAYLQRALELHSKKGLNASVADAHVKIAQVLLSYFPDKSRDAEAHFRSAVSVYDSLRDGSGQARALLALANYYSAQRQYPKADAAFNQGLTIARISQIPQLSADVLAQWGDAYLNAGDSDKAIAVFREAAELYHSLKVPSLEAISLRGVALGLRRLHRGSEALDTAQKAVALSDTGESWYARYWTRRVLAWVCSDQGKYENAVKVLREARDISDSADQKQLAGWASLSLTYVLHVLGEWEEALSETNSALRIFGDSKDIENLIAAYSTLVDAYGSRESPLKDLPKALSAYDEASKLSTDLGLTADLDLSAVEVLWQMGRYEEAARLCTRTLEYFISSKNQIGEANALMSLAEVQRSSRRLTEATRSLSRAESLVRTSDDLYSVGRLHYGEASLLKKKGLLKDSIAEYERVIALAEQVKSGAKEESQRSFAENYGFIYDELIDTLYLASQAEPQEKAKYSSKAFAYAEANKARVFLNAWGRVFASAIRKRLPSGIQEKERSLTARIEATEAQLAAGSKAEKDTQVLQQEFVNEKRELQTLVSYLRSAHPDYAQVQYPTSVSLSQIPLRSGEVLVEFKVMDDAILAWMIKGTTSGSVMLDFYKTPTTREWLRSRIIRLREGLNGGRPDDFDPIASEELFRTLFPSGRATRLLQATSIIVVPDDYLSLIPFEVLSPKASRGEFVFLGTATKYFPSAAALALSRVSQRQTQWQKSFLGIADPITSTSDDRFELLAVASSKRWTNESLGQAGRSPPGATTTRGLSSLDRLPATASEVTAIASLFPGGDEVELRIGAAANKPDLLATDLRRFRFVHFATHGILPQESGLREPALVLSYDGGGPEDMVLSISQIPELNLSADMVVLSACNTGTGKVSRAEGVYNLGRAFLAAGASSVVASLWQVADKSTETLMQEFYKNIRAGKSKSESLAIARRSLAVSKTYGSPFYWAPFVLMGD